MSLFINSALLPISLAVIMLGIGLSLKWSDFAALRQKKSAVFSGFILQVIALPLLAFLLITAWGIEGQYAVAIMIVACCPGGVTSNALTFIFSGVVALSVVLTLLSSIVAPLTIPLVTDWSLAYFLAHQEHFLAPSPNVIGDAASHEFALLPTVGKLFVLSVVPIVVGNLIQHFAPEWCAKNNRHIRRFSGLLFVVVIILMAAVNYTLLSKVVGELGFFIVVMVACAIALGFFGAALLRQNEAVRLTLAIEVGIQNAGMGLIITGTVLNNPTMSMVLIAYGIVMQVPMIGFATWYRHRAMAEQPVA